MSNLASTLSQLPLFADLPTKDLESLLGAFREQSAKTGEVLFEAGAQPSAVWILLEGSLSIRDTSGEVLQLSPPEQVGELSALTGEDRNLTAIVTEPSKLLAISPQSLLEYLATHGSVGSILHRNLLRVAARKIGRDRRRLSEMKDNIKSTQAAMKEMRDNLLNSEDTPLHAALFEELDALVEQNRKIHYLVEPSRMLPTDLQLDASTHKVTALSNEWLYFSKPPSSTKAGDDLSGVLNLAGRQIPVSGTVERVSEEEASIYLDNLIPEYDEALGQHLNRAQLLDTVL